MKKSQTLECSRLAKLSRYVALHYFSQVHIHTEDHQLTRRRKLCCVSVLCLSMIDPAKWMYADQSRASVDREKTVFETVADSNDDIMLGTRSVKSRAYLSWFNFKGADQQKPVGSLSGGEVNRLALAQVVKAGGNLLLGGKLYNEKASNGFRRRICFLDSNEADYAYTS